MATNSKMAASRPQLGRVKGPALGGKLMGSITANRPKLGPMRREVKQASKLLNKKSGQVYKPPVQVPGLKPTPTATGARKSLVAGNPRKAQRQLNRSVGLGRKQLPM